MKKNQKIFILFLLVLSMSLFLACPTGVPYGWGGSLTNPDDATGGSGGGGGPSNWDKIFVHQGYNCFDVMVWEATFAGEFTESSFKATAGSKGWFGGGFVSYPEGTAYLDLSKVKTIKFKLKTSIPANKLIFYVQSKKADVLSVKKYLSEYAVTTSATNWVDCVIDLSTASETELKTITNAFTIVAEGTTAESSWLEVTEIDFFDGDNEQVVVDYAE